MIECRIPLVIQGLDSCFSFWLDSSLIGANLFTILLTFLQNVENALFTLVPKFPVISIQFIVEMAVSEKLEKSRAFFDFTPWNSLDELSKQT